MNDVYLVTPEKERLDDELVRVGVDSYALRMSQKGVALNILVKDLKSPAANILKQECIASGMDAAVKRGVISCSVDVSNVLIMGNYNNYNRLIKRLKIQAFGLPDVAKKIQAILNAQKPTKIIANKKEISLDKTLVMGILNTTPDSFSDGGKYTNNDAISKQIDDMISLGVDIIDIGGMSSRPNSEHVDSKEEIKRISYALQYAVSRNAIVSIDTCNEDTVKYAIDNGADIINDITGLQCDNITKLCADSGVAVCIMHMIGTPSDMQKRAEYSHIIYDIKDFFAERVEKAINAGIAQNSLILDVGFGFAKTLEHNYMLLKYMQEFAIMNLPLLVGVSRKSMIGDIVGANVDERLTGTIAANTYAIMNGANIIRVHDVREGIDTIKICDTIRKANIR